MALVKKFDKNHEYNTTYNDYPKAYYRPTGIKLILKHEMIEVTISVYATKEARDKDADVIQKIKHNFTFKEFDINKANLIGTAYNLIKVLDDYKDAKNV